jgi:CheY-like chemotaxis protein
LPRINALLVEDDLETQVKIREMLAAMGYAVTAFSDSLSAREYQHLGTVIDLIVLDRNIPYINGGADSSKIGDELLDYMWAKYPDSAFIVFTGNADLDSVHHALRERGSFELEDYLSVQRVQHFTKLETLKFRTAAQQIVQYLDRLNAVELIARTENDTDRRVLRRVAYRFQGESVTATELEGGSTDDKVWECKVSAGATPVADIVVKIGRQLPPIGSFQALLPASTLVARSIVPLSGLMGGRVATIYSSAGEVSGSLHDEILLRPNLAAQFTRDVSQGLQGIVETRSRLEPLDRLVAPYITWEKLEERLVSLGITPPPRSLPVTSRVYAQHGDLHPGNVLICGDQAIIIDLDSQTMGSGLVDPVALFWGAVFNKNSRIKDQAWPSLALCSSFPAPSDSNSDLVALEASLQDCHFAEWVMAAWDWLATRSASPREYWVLTLAFAARQLKYPDVQASELQKGRAEALVRRAVNALSA